MDLNRLSSFFLKSVGAQFRSFHCTFICGAFSKGLDNFYFLSSKSSIIITVVAAAVVVVTNSWATYGSVQGFRDYPWL